MKKKEIQDRYNTYIKNLNRYNENYYIKSKPLISDKEYDDIKLKIINLEKQYNFLNSRNSPSLSVGYKPSKNFKKALHKVPMLSLGNAFTEDDLLNFEKKF